MYESIALIVLAYLLGAVPFGLIISGKFYKKDIRKFGSGNIGATNVYRTLGSVAGASVLLCDVLKGLLPVVVAKYVLASDQDLAAWVSVLAGLAAIVGHSYSVFLNFGGGKGMATAGGMIVGLWPIAVPILLSLWVIIILITRYVSLASILVALLLPILVAMLYPRPEYIIVSVAAGLIIVYRHRSNIVRLIGGTELKIGKK